VCSSDLSYKSSTDLVTSVDRESEEYLFSAVKVRFPGHSVVAEEGSRSETSGEHVWYIDPLDATNNYAHGIPFFCVSIALYSRSLPGVVAGVVFDPMHEELFTAWRGGGSTLNGRPIRVSGTGNLDIAFLATGFPYDRSDPQRNNLHQFNRFSPRVQGIRRIGSAAMDLCYLAAGRFDGYWEPMLHPWDTAAGSLIVEEAGGRVSRYDGGAFDPEFPEILASNGILHEQMVAVLGKA
jgi:myo-inositol-1(or 4)-monophosphatase